MLLLATNNFIIKPTSQFEVTPHENKYLKGTSKCGQGGIALGQEMLILTKKKNLK